MMNKVYYQEMLKKERLIPFFKDNRLVCFLTFYITNDETKYINANPWDILDDDFNGTVCYISQLLTDKNSDNPRLAFEIWSRFKKYIKFNFSSVKTIYWRRWDKINNIVKTYKKEI